MTKHVTLCVMPKTVHFLNGEFLSEEELLISPRDLGFARGFAVFDFLKTYPRHRPFKLKEHIDRLFVSAGAIGLELPWSKDEVRSWILKTLEANEHEPKEKFIKIMVSGGYSKSMVPTGKPTIIILIDPAVQYPKEWYEKGAGIVTEKFTRYLPNAKTNNYIEGVRQTMRAEKEGAMEPVYYSDTQVFEGSNSNIFAVMNNVLVTPKSGILEGITRAVLLEILSLDIPIETNDFSLQELQQASEVFLSASGKEIVPITKIDGVPVAQGAVGPVTKEVMRQFHEYTSSNNW